MEKKIVKPGQNKLSGETSPYLLQHADNPVDWYPWGDEALNKAREENKPILLSIGYSACHWCHVMAHESFENPQIAEQMNRLFVNIKVDREERPDLDRVYQTAHQVLAQRAGGWPLTVFLDPEDQMPFFAGTYFPPTTRQGMPGFADVLMRIDEFYRKEHEGLRKQAESLQAVLTQIEAPAGEDLPAATVFAQARQALEQDFDRRYGGFGQAPKFPHPSFCQRLLRHWRATAKDPNPDVQALYMVSHTLGQMARGGLYDQLGGGFFRYSVDAYWAIPHFEKMLYDNARLLKAYFHLLQLTPTDPIVQEVVGKTQSYIKSKWYDSKDGGFFGNTDVHGEDEYYGEKVIDALNFGFSFTTSILIKKENYIFEILNIKDYTKRKDLERIRARIIGKSGKTLKALQELTKCYFELKDNNVGIIGDSEYIKNAQEAIIAIIRGAKQSNVYSFLEKNQVKPIIDLGLK
ncbi:MAG: DUF255 domain-containing protein [Proteobacteria bacterium]|nr:DUF255 domain-containing protein [Pseudomonadota bacterium]